MRETRITLPELILVAGTRAALGGGLGLLLADRLNMDQRRAVGWTLFLVGGARAPSLSPWRSSAIAACPVLRNGPSESRPILVRQRRIAASICTRTLDTVCRQQGLFLPISS